MRLFRILVSTVLMTGLGVVGVATVASPSDPPVLVRKWQHYDVYVANGPGEPVTWGTYSVRVLTDDPPFFIDGLVKLRSGSIAKWWLSDMAGDGRPEIIIWIMSGGSGAIGQLDVYEFDGKKLHEVHIVDPPRQLMEGYRCCDRYAVEGHSIIRSFPKYSPGDPNANPTAGAMRIEYVWKERKWVRSK